MSFLKKLFGGGGSGGEKGNDSAGSGTVAKAVEHKGFTVRATPYKDGGQYQTCGVIAKVTDGVAKEHKFIRADRFQSLEEAADFALLKGRQIVDEQGERLFG